MMSIHPLHLTATSSIIIRITVSSVTRFFPPLFLPPDVSTAQWKNTD